MTVRQALSKSVFDHFIDEVARHIQQEFNARFGAAAVLPQAKRARAKVA